MIIYFIPKTLALPTDDGNKYYLEIVMSHESTIQEQHTNIYSNTNGLIRFNDVVEFDIDIDCIDSSNMEIRLFSIDSDIPKFTVMLHCNKYQNDGEITVELFDGGNMSVLYASIVSSSSDMCKDTFDSLLNKLNWNLSSQSMKSNAILTNICYLEQRLSKSTFRNDPEYFKTRMNIFNKLYSLLIDRNNQNVIECRNVTSTNALNRLLREPCQICYNELNDYCILNCNHVYCRGCLVKLVGVSADSGKLCKCPDIKCKYLLNLTELFELYYFDDKNILSEIIIRNTLSSVANVLYCPNENCGCVVVPSSRDDNGNDDTDIPSNPKTICLTCKYCFCSDCKGQWHEN